MPFCMNCGTKLPDRAKFCMECGTPLGQAAPAQAAAGAEPPAAERRTPPQSQPQGAKHTRGCTRKQGNLVRVPGDGLYFTDWDGASLYRLGEGEQKPKKLNRRVDGCYLDGLNYWRGGIYYLREDMGGGLILHRYDTATGIKKEVRPLPKLWGEPHGVGAVVWDGVLYGHGMDQACITALDLSTLAEREIPLPDLRGKPLPQEWREREPYMEENHSGERSYAQRLTGLYVLDGYAYLSVCGASYLNIRFPLDDPEGFAFLPYDSCCAMRKYGALCPVGSGKLLGTGNLGGTLYLTDLKSGRKVVAIPDLCTNGFGWWSLGGRFFLENIMLDLKAMKRYRLPFRLDAQDFVPDGAGGVWVLSLDGGLYRLPPEAWGFKGQDELERCRVLTLDD